MALAKRHAVHVDHGHERYGTQVSQESWAAAPGKMRMTSLRKRRILLVLGVLWATYLFIRYIPTDVPSVGRRVDLRTGLSQGRPFPFDPRLTLANQQKSVSGQLYDGPVKFYHLAGSLRLHAQNRYTYRDNVLFVLYDLSSASRILSSACAMARYDKNNVHVALITARDDSIEDIMAVNGLGAGDCPMYWHDGRPDHNGRSTAARQAVAIRSALTHMHAVLKYKVAFIDEGQAHSSRFDSTLRACLDSMWVALNVLPTTGMDWILSLEGNSLAALPRTQIDISIQPYRNSAGSLIRLLESLRNADYQGLPQPGITIDLPHDVDPFALRYLEDFRWPSDSKLGESKLTLRRHLDTKLLRPPQASLRTIESFYPTSQPTSHVLVLSPDVEVGPNYLHYLYFTTLECKSNHGNIQTTKSLAGISLDLPNVALDGISPFVVDNSIGSPLLLHQAPSSTAALYFGDKWIELQDYAALRLKQDPELAKDVRINSQFSHDCPAWLRLASELMQARNYFMLYPNFASSPETRLATVHHEVSQAPEEYWSETTKPADAAVPAMTESTVLTASGDVSQQNRHEQNPPSRPVLGLLGLTDNEGFPNDSALPRISFKGQHIDDDQARTIANEYADHLSLDIGGCHSLSERDASKIAGMEYLFCLNNPA